MKARRLQSWWPFLKRALTLIFFAALIVLLVSRAESIDWDRVLLSLREMNAALLTLAAALATLSYALYSGFELLAKRYTLHREPKGRVLATAFVSYAFNLNLGSWVGGVGFRYRMYSRFGLGPGLITRILGFCVVTNWFGYVAVAGAVFASGLLVLPQEWRLGSGALRLLGFALLALAMFYLGACARARRRSWTVRGLKLELPSPRMALAQLALSSTNWLVIASILFVLLRGQVDYASVLAVFLVSSIAGAVAHVPAGLGVIEAVFVSLLGQQVSPDEILAALLAYRAIYYLAPLMLATAIYTALEVRTRHAHASAH